MSPELTQHVWCIWQAVGLGTALGVIVWMIWLSKRLIIELDGIWHERQQHGKT